MSNAFDKASLVMLPHAYEEGKLYSLKPTDRSGDFTFSRGTDTATRVNASGNIEKETQNLFTYSNTFSNSSWLKADTSVTGGQSGYDGTNDAWLLEITGGTGFQTLRKQPISHSGVNTFSFYAKAGTLSWVRVNMGFAQTYFDIGNGVVDSFDSSIGASIEAAGNGYYRCIVPVSGSSTTFYIYPASGSGNVSQSSGNLYIQDAQWEQGLVARDYIETTTAPVYGGLTDDMPRLDYSGGATCPSLLLEPSRTQLLPQSEYITTLSNTTPEYNKSISPEGIVNAGNYYPSSTGTGRGINFSATGTTATTYTNSVYAKANGFNVVWATDVNNSIYGVYFDLSNGTISGADASNADIIDVGNGWYRLIYTSTSTSTTIWTRFGFANAAGYALATANGTDGVYFWGLQLEAGSYPTSYIPTYGSSQTRAAEGQTYTGFSSLIGQTEGTLFLEIEGHSPNGTEIFSLNRTTTNAIFLDANNDIYRVIIWADGVSSTTFTSIANTDKIKIAVAYQSNNFAIYANGSQILTNNTWTWTPNILIDTLNFNVGGYVNAKNSSKFNQLLLFKERLTNADLATLTTL